MFLNLVKINIYYINDLINRKQKISRKSLTIKAILLYHKSCKRKKYNLLSS